MGAERCVGRNIDEKNSNLDSEELIYKEEKPVKKEKVYFL